MKILLCEDDFMMVKAIEHRLTRDTHQVVAATDGKSATEKVKAENFDLVITDLLMPFSGGMELLHVIRRELKLQTPVIVLSKLGNESTILEAFNLGANDYLTKPFSPNELSIRISKLVPEKKESDNAPAKNLTDLSYLREIADGDKNFMNEMISFFVENVPAILTEMQQCILRSNFSALLDLTNKFTHHLAFVGLSQSLADVEAIEKIASSGNGLNRLPSLMDKVSEDCRKAIEELKRIDRYSL